MNLANATSLFKIYREINPETIRHEAQRRFTLLVGGDPELARSLAETLSREPGQAGVHPWLNLDPGDPQPGSLRPDLALFVSRDATLSAETVRALEALHRSNTPCVVAVASSTVQAQVGARLPRTYEAERILLADEPSRKELGDKLVPALLKATPKELRLALAHQLPLVREAFIPSLIEETARANALYSVSTGLAATVPLLNIPFNVADVVVLTKNQLIMAYKIALASGKEGDPKEVLGEIVSVLGGGFFFRQIAREMVGLIPVVGFIPNIAVSYAGTHVIGRVVCLWASGRPTPDRADLGRLYRQAMIRGRQVAMTLRPKRGKRPAELPAALPGVDDPLGDKVGDKAEQDRARELN